MFDKIGFTSVTFRGKSVEEVLKIAKENSIDYIEWGGDVHIANAVDMIKCLGSIKESGIRASSYGSYYVVGDNNMEKFKTLCYLACQLEANIIRVWLGNKSSAKTSMQEVKEYVCEVQLMAEIARTANLIIAFEFHNNTYNDSSKSCVGILRAIGKDNVKTYWQPLANGHDLMTLTEIVYYVVGIHVFHWSKFGARKPLKKGIKEWSEYFQLLSDRKLKPIIIMEFVKGDSVVQFGKDVKVLRQLLKNID